MCLVHLLLCVPLLIGTAVLILSLCSLYSLLCVHFLIKSTVVVFPCIRSLYSRLCVHLPFPTAHLIFPYMFSYSLLSVHLLLPHIFYVHFLHRLVFTLLMDIALFIIPVYVHFMHYLCSRAQSRCAHISSMWPLLCVHLCTDTGLLSVTLLCVHYIYCHASRVTIS